MIGDPMLLLIDEDVPRSAIDVLRDRGHDVMHAHELTAPGTPDAVVAKIGDEARAIVVTCNVKDFKALASRMPEGNRARFRRLGLIALRCNQSQAANRLRHHIESIEFHHARVLRLSDKRLFVELLNDKIYVND